MVVAPAAGGEGFELEVGVEEVEAVGADGDVAAVVEDGGVGPDAAHGGVGARVVAEQYVLGELVGVSLALRIEPERLHLAERLRGVVHPR